MQTPKRSGPSGLMIAALSALCVFLTCGTLFAGGAWLYVRSFTEPGWSTAITTRPAQTGSNEPAVIATERPAESTPPATPVAPVTAAIREPSIEATFAPDTGARGDADTQRTVLRESAEYVASSYVYANYDAAAFQARVDALRERISAGMSEVRFWEEMKRLIASLGDNHSQFETRAEVRERLRNSYVGIGVMLGANDEQRYLYLTVVFPGSPAEQAGLRPHDHILGIDGSPAVNDRGEGQMERLRGEPGTEVRVTVRTPGREPREVRIVRNSVEVAAETPHRLIDGADRIGYILIRGFDDDDVIDATGQALRNLDREANGRLKGLIIDMRINGGGGINALYRHLCFFTEGEMGDFVNRAGDKEPLKAFDKGVGDSQRVPIAILTSPATASFAEVFAGALKHRDPGRVILVGAPTQGNIEVLNGIDLNDGSTLYLATQTFRLPDGRGWENEGLQPDVPVAATWDSFGADDPDPVIAAALQALSR
jgi:carboxyl-terminal processing protease